MGSQVEKAEDAIIDSPLEPPFDQDAGLKEEKEAILLPVYRVAIQYWVYRSYSVLDDVDGFLKDDLDVSRLDAIHDLLWWAGRPVPPRPLHRHAMMDRKIIISEQADLHLLWLPGEIFIKPLPQYLLSYTFWKDNLCSDARLYRNAVGFLLSYFWIIRHKSDLKLAIDTGLIEGDVTWENWLSFMRSFTEHLDPNQPKLISKRYEYGELRLPRLDQIFSFAPRFGLKNLRDGYYHSPSTNREFFRKNVAWVTTISVVYLAIILSAMQVGLNTKYL